MSTIDDLTNHTYQNTINKYERKKKGEMKHLFVLLIISLAFFNATCVVREKVVQQTLSASIESKNGGQDNGGENAYVLTQEKLDNLIKKIKQNTYGQGLFEKCEALNGNVAPKILLREPDSGNSANTDVHRMKIYINPSVKLPVETPKASENFEIKVQLSLVYELGNCLDAESHRSAINCVCAEGGEQACSSDEYATRVLRGESHLKRASYFHDENFGDLQKFQQMFNNKLTSKIAYRLVTKTLENLPINIKLGDIKRFLQGKGVDAKYMTGIEKKDLLALLNEHLDNGMMRLIMFEYRKKYGMVGAKTAFEHYRTSHAKQRFKRCKELCKPSQVETTMWENCG